MEFVVEFYQYSTGRSPVREFLHDLKRDQPELHRLMTAGISRLMNSENHGEPLTKQIGDGLYELRIGHRNMARVLWFYTAGPKIVLVHGFVKKRDRILEADRRKALERKADYERRRQLP